MACQCGGACGQDCPCQAGGNGCQCSPGNCNCKITNSIGEDTSLLAPAVQYSVPVGNNNHMNNKSYGALSKRKILWR